MKSHKKTNIYIYIYLLLLNIIFSKCDALNIIRNIYHNLLNFESQFHQFLVKVIIWSNILLQI